jgi:two-component system, chemotaxis family, protein-glutamate methylesterase/glutaminase
MTGIRVLVVDDSVVIRKVLCEALAADPEIEVVGSAADGHIALSKIAALSPDLITLDVEMPVMPGIETLVAIRKLYPKLPVIMFSTLTERGAAITLEALSLGASDYLTKPGDSGSLEETRARIQAELIPKVKMLCWRRTEAKPALAAVKAPLRLVAPARRPGFAGHIELVAIGASTGGPNALTEVLRGLSGEFPVPIVVVQHMPPFFTRLLAERLNKHSAIRIREGEAGSELKPGEAWIAPGDFHMRVVREGKTGRLVMSQEPPQNSCRPAVDVLFDSVAQAYRANTLAVVLTGMGSDGVKGSQRIRDAGGQVIVQDEASSVVWGMPGQVAAAGLAEAVLPLDEIAEEIERRANRNRLLTPRKEARTLPTEKTNGRAERRSSNAEPADKQHR